MVNGVTYLSAVGRDAKCCPCWMGPKAGLFERRVANRINVHTPMFMQR